LPVGAGRRSVWMSARTVAATIRAGYHHELERRDSVGVLHVDRQESTPSSDPSAMSVEYVEAATRCCAAIITAGPVTGPELGLPSVCPVTGPGKDARQNNLGFRL